MAGLPLLIFFWGGRGGIGEIAHLAQNNVVLRKSFFLTVGRGLN